MNLPTVVSRDEWLAARKDLLVKEKAATRARDVLNTERRELPMVQIEKEYIFDTPDGKRTLLDLFDGGRQLTSTTSCSIRAGTRAARAARCWWTTSATCPTCMRGTPR